MLNYHGEHGTFPPAAVFSKEGKPLLSWRVLVLPYLNQEDLYKQFKLDEPWNSTHNMRLISKMPPVFKPFDGRRIDPHTTLYQVFVGKGAAFEGIKGTSIADFPDGTSNTILIAQAEEAVPWTKPIDLEFSQDKPLPKLGGIFPDSFQVAFGDMSASSIPASVSEATLRGMITRNGGEQLEIGWR